MKRLLVFTAFLFAATHALAQTPAPAAKPAPAARPAPPAAPPPPPPLPPAPPAPPREGQPINIRVEITISESGGTLPPVKKTVTTVVGDGHSGSVRESAPFNTPLNVDVHADILANNKLRVGSTVEYWSNAQMQPGTDARPGRTDVRASVVSVLDSGKPLMISEATDPISDRRVTVEVTATILK